MFLLCLSTSVLDCKFSEICLSKRGKMIFQIVVRLMNGWGILALSQRGTLLIDIFLSDIMAIDIFLLYVSGVGR